MNNPGRTFFGQAAIIAVIACAFTISCANGGDPVKETFSYSGVEFIVVNGSFFDVEIKGRSQNVVEGTVTISDRQRRRGVKVNRELTGSTLKLTVETPRRWAGFLSLPGSSIEIGAPIDTELEIGTGSGSITVEAIKADAIMLSASSGRINISDCEGTLSAESSSGRINIESCDGLKTLSASSGAIVVQASDGDIEGQTSSGKIDLTDVTGALDLRASSGKIQGEQVTLTGNSSFRTSSGSIVFDFTNDIDRLKLELESSSGQIVAGGTSAKGTVITGNGDILVKGKSTSGRQNYK